MIIDVDAEVLGKLWMDESMAFTRPVEFGKVGNSTGLLFVSLPINGNITPVVEIGFWVLVQGIKGRCMELRFTSTILSPQPTITPMSSPGMGLESDGLARQRIANVIVVVK
ncbi:hypothetical protein BELL_0070g00130 [Botrytis elliptica]|uniref:Uncharacterized protein n=1 Tax=Botrytis elliptica TaxID=278938 RepID=A0A4Z1JXR6_9HELO|nr:hypothetical protein BELL_0070g00130 [Botrytis elliptica]